MKIDDKVQTRRLNLSGHEFFKMRPEVYNILRDSLIFILLSL